MIALSRRYYLFLLLLFSPVILSRSFSLSPLTGSREYRCAPTQTKGAKYHAPHHDANSQDDSNVIIRSSLSKEDREELTLPNIFPRETLLTFLPWIPLLFLLPAWGIDHPADYSHLSIPNPIPDADPRFFISGGLCAATSHGITTPIDVVKTRMQAAPEIYNGGLLQTAATIVKEEGGGTLLQGLAPTVVGYGLEGAAKFGLYESLKPEMARLLPFDNSAIPYLIASVVAGAVAALMLCPMEKTRIRLVTDPDFATSFLTGIPRLIEESGLLCLFSGLPAMLSKQVPYTFAKQVSFDMFASLLYTAAAGAGLMASDVKIEVLFGAAFLASILACILSHPGDVVLTATYKDPTAMVGFPQVVSKISKEQGAKGFVTGLSARFLHVGAIITSQLVLYDTIKQLLGLPATGT